MSALGLVTIACTADRRGEPDSAELRRLAQCSDAANAVVSPAGLGPIRLGMHVRDVARSCRVADTVVHARGDSGRNVMVHFGAHDVLLVAGSDSTIQRVVIADSAFRTDRGIGVGSRVRTLRFAYGRICAVERQGEPVLAVAGLDGIVFSFDPSHLPTTVYRKEILGSELVTKAADDIPIRGMEIGRFKSPCPDQRLAVYLDFPDRPFRGWIELLRHRFNGADG